MGCLKYPETVAKDSNIDLSFRFYESSSKSFLQFSETKYRKSFLGFSVANLEHYYSKRENRTLLIFRDLGFCIRSKTRYAGTLNQKMCIMVSNSGVVLANAELEVGAFFVLLLTDKADFAGLFVFALGQHFAEWSIIKIFHVVWIHFVAHIICHHSHTHRPRLVIKIVLASRKRIGSS